MPQKESDVLEIYNALVREHGKIAIISSLKYSKCDQIFTNLRPENGSRCDAGVNDNSSTDKNEIVFDSVVSPLSFMQEVYNIIS